MIDKSNHRSVEQLSGSISEKKAVYWSDWDSRFLMVFHLFALLLSTNLHCQRIWIVHYCCHKLYFLDQYCYSRPLLGSGLPYFAEKAWLRHRWESSSLHSCQDRVWISKNCQIQFLLFSLKRAVCHLLCCTVQLHAWRLLRRIHDSLALINLR